jgi:hypothetical protein
MGFISRYRIVRIVSLLRKVKSCRSIEPLVRVCDQSTRNLIVELLSSARYYPLLGSPKAELPSPPRR